MKTKGQQTLRKQTLGFTIDLLGEATITEPEAVAYQKQYLDLIDGLCREVRSAPRVEGSGRIYLPGEIEWDRRRKALVEGKGGKITMGTAAHRCHSVTVTPMALSIAARLAHSSAKTWSR